MGVEYSFDCSNNSGARYLFCKNLKYQLNSFNRFLLTYHNVTTTDVYALSGDPYSRAKPKSPTY